METHGVTGVANARWFSRRAIFGMGVLLAAFTAQPAIGQVAKPTPGERERYDERTWTIPDGFTADIVESSRESVVAGSPRPRFVLLKDSLTTLPKTERPMTLDILQEFVAPQMFIVDDHPVDAVIRLETSVDIDASFFMKEHYAGLILSPHNHRVHYAIYLRDKDGERVTLRPPSDGANVYYISPQGPGTKSFSVPCRSGLNLAVADIMAKHDSFPLTKGEYSLMPVTVGFGIKPSNHRQPGACEPGEDDVSAETVSPEAIEQMFWRYQPTSRHPGRETEHFKWHAFNVRWWSVVPGRAFASFGLQFDLRSDGTLGYEREEMINWCVYVPEGELEIRDVVTSVPLVRCSWTDEAKSNRLFPLLSVDTLRTLPTR